MSLTLPDIGLGHGSGSSLPLPVLALAGLSTIIAVAVSGVSIWLQLRNYRKPLLQRMVVRIMVMVPLYAVSSLISLFSLEAAFFIDAIRDIYEAFVIYCFFVLLLDYLGGERSLLILLHGRPPIPAVFPASLWRSELDSSDPYTFLFLKRGILQYVQVKPLLALASLVMKATGTYNEGDFRARSGYLYVSIVYNISICLALWCLAVFWMCVNEDLKPFRPVPKFLCVKGILFFSFWQSIIVSFLVAVGVITRLGPYTDSEHISLGLTDTLICIEMPFFAAAHMYAFSYRDFIRPPASAVGKRNVPIYVARMTLGYALRDAFGLKDLVEDTRATLGGAGINYRAFEPSEGGMHIGAARDRRIRAGLRYAAGGRHKYWLPEVRGRPENDRDITAPLFVDEDEDVVHHTPDMRSQRDGGGGGLRIPWGDVEVEDEDEYSLTFDGTLAGAEGVDEVLYEQAKNYVFGDYLYPVVDVSSEEARRAMWEEEERVVREIASGGYSRREGASLSGYGATTQSGNRQAKMYDEDEEDGAGMSASAGKAHHHDVPSSPRAPRTPSPLLRSRHGGSTDCPPLHRSHSPTLTQSAPSRLRLPHFFSSLSSSSPGETPSSLSSASPRALKRTSRAPLAQDDAVDLVIPAPEGLQVPSTPRGPHSPHGPALIRVWDERHPGSDGPTRRVVGGREEEQTDSRGEEGSRRERGRAHEDEDGYEYGEGSAPAEEVVREQTPPPYARVHGYEFGIPEEREEEEELNPWA